MQQIILIVSFFITSIIGFLIGICGMGVCKSMTFYQLIPSLGVCGCNSGTLSWVWSCNGKFQWRRRDDEIWWDNNEIWWDNNEIWWDLMKNKESWDNMRLEYKNGTWEAVNQEGIPAHSQGGRTTISGNQTRERTRLHPIHSNVSYTEGLLP